MDSFKKENITTIENKVEKPVAAAILNETKRDVAISESMLREMKNDRTPIYNRRGINSVNLVRTARSSYLREINKYNVEDERMETFRKQLMEEEAQRRQEDYAVLRGNGIPIPTAMGETTN